MESFIPLLNRDSYDGEVPKMTLESQEGLTFGNLCGIQVLQGRLSLFHSKPLKIFPKRPPLCKIEYLLIVKFIRFQPFFTIYVKMV